VFGGKFNHESRFFLDEYEVSGVETLNFAYSTSSSVGKALGTSRGFTSVNGPNQQSLTLNRNLIYEDYILNYTGDSQIKASIYYDGNHYGFNEGYLSSYSLACAVGSVPKTSANILVYDEIKIGVDASDNFEVKPHPILDIPSQGSISVSCDNSSTNRVISFGYTINIPRKAFYKIGGGVAPSTVRLITPIEYSSAVVIDVDDAFIQNSFDFFDDRENKNINLTVKGRNGEDLQSVTIPNATLLGESLEASADGGLRLTLNYKGHQ
jgi:hypothetical protein